MSMQTSRFHVEERIEANFWGFDVNVMTRKQSFDAKPPTCVELRERLHSMLISTHFTRMLHSMLISKVALDTFHSNVALDADLECCTRC